MPDEPTDEELVAFAAEMLGDLGASFRDAGVLQETISENRLLWQTLYVISERQSPALPPSGEAPA